MRWYLACVACLTCDVWRLAFGVGRLTLSIWRLVFGVRCSVFGVWCLTFGVTGGHFVVSRIQERETSGPVHEVGLGGWGAGVRRAATTDCTCRPAASIYSLSFTAGFGDGQSRLHQRPIQFREEVMHQRYYMRVHISEAKLPIEIQYQIIQIRNICIVSPVSPHRRTFRELPSPQHF